MQNKVQKCKLEGQLETGWFRYLKIAPFFCLEWLWRLKSNFAKLLLNLRGDFAKSISFPARSYKIVK